MQWVSSLSQSNYRNFKRGEPNGTGKESCVELIPGRRHFSFRSWNGRWNDYKCSNKMGYICERVVDICVAQKPCDKNALCESDEDGGYSCTCNCGYLGDGKTCVKSDPYAYLKVR